MKSFIFSLIIAIFTPLIANAYDFTTENFNFNFIGSTNDVVLCSQVETTPNVTIPSTISFRGRTFNITVIANGAFRGRDVQSVVIPEGVKTIGDNAFRNTEIQQIIIPNSVQEIGEYAFANCPNLSYVEFGKGIISSRYVRSLRYTFADDDNIERIVFRGKRPPYHIDDFPAFTNMAKQFAQVYVPINGYLHFKKSQWGTNFAKPISVYSPDGEAPDVVPYAIYFWEDEKVDTTHRIKGVRYVYKGDTPVEIPAELILEEMNGPTGGKIVRMTFNTKMGNGDFPIASQTFYSFINSSKFSEITGKNWTIVDADADPSVENIKVNFYNGKFAEPKKFLGSYSNGSFKKVDASIMKVIIEAGGNLSDFQGEFKVTEMPEELLVFTPSNN